ncbi:MAG: 50S ribosomal protein L44e [Candidatus Diapherotrites archaeon CG08_land_8_20_14_0_20_34_12]|nr:MAG: 50S ribosomal protein L44e [Candidatus Diapherotrites archaeon CG08_land_8_20_14_0_20_34_12]
MIVPKSTMDYCRKCNIHTEHKLKLYKSGAARALSSGQRRNVAKKKGYKGKYQFPAIVKKVNKRPTFVLECSVCHAKHYKVVQKRMKKTEFE